MNRIGLKLLLCLLSACAVSAEGQTHRRSARASAKSLLVVTVTKGFRHRSIPTAERVIQELGQQNGWRVDFARTDEELRQKTARQQLASYDGVIFANTSGDLPLADREEFLRWINQGHAFIGIHAASDTFNKGVFPPYIEMLGGEFNGHDRPMRVTLMVEDRTHPATRHLGERFAVFDEIYRICNFDRTVAHVLLVVDFDPVSKEPGYYPLAWTKLYGKGRVFYTAFGHHDEVLQADWFRQHLRGGIRWALGEERAASTPQFRGKDGRIACK